MDHAEERTGLNFLCFTLKAISVNTKGDGRSRLVGGQLLKDNDEEDKDTGGINCGEEAGAVSMRHTLNSGRVWSQGATTVDKAFKIVQDYKTEHRAKATEKEK